MPTKKIVKFIFPTAESNKKSTINLTQKYLISWSFTFPQFIQNLK